MIADGDSEMAAGSFNALSSSEGAGRDTAFPRPVIVASNFYPHFGGVEETVRQLALHQLAAGSRPLVLTMRWPRELPKTDVIDGIDVRRYAFRGAERHPKLFIEALLHRASVLRRVTADIRSHRASVVHVQCVGINGWYALRASRQLGLPLVVTLQGELTMDASHLYERSRVVPNVLRDLLRQAHAVTACSAATLEEAQRWGNVDLGRRGSVIYNGVSLADFHVPPAEPSTRRPYVFAIGRLVPQKGFDVLLRAFAAAVGCGFPYDLVLGGEGEEQGNLQGIAEQLGVAGRVVFLGAVIRRDVPGLFAGAKFFVLPSRHEPMGIVNLEAMAASRAVVATRVGGVPELIADGETGLLVPPGDVSQLADALVQLSRDPNLAIRLGRAGRVRAERFDWSAIRRDYDTVYQQAAELMARGLNGGPPRR